MLAANEVIKARMLAANKVSVIKGSDKSKCME